MVKKTGNTLFTFSKVLLIISITLSLIPFIFLSFFTYPNAEDFSLSIIPQYTSPLFSVVEYYLNYDARLFTNLLYAINPLVYKSLWAYKFLPLIMITGLFTSVFLLVKEVLTKINKKTYTLLTTALIFCLFSGQMPSPVHAFYWMASGLNYTVSLCLLLLLLSLIIRIVKKIYQKQKPSISFLLLCVILVYCIVLSNEIYILSLLLIFGSTYVLAFLKKRPERNLYLLLFIVASLASFIYFIPSILMSDTVSRNYEQNIFMASVIYATKQTFYNVLKWIFLNPSLLILTSIFIVSAPHIPEIPDASKRAFIPLYFFIPLICIFLIILLFPYYMFRGFEHEPQRIFNMQYMFFLLSWFYTFYYVIVKKMKSQKVYSILSRPPIILTLVVAFALSVCAMKNVSMAYHDLISGKAMDYASQMSERIKSCEIAQKNIDKAALVKIIENKPLTISFPPDLLEGQEESIWFDAYRKYFNLKVIKLEERSTDD